MIYIYTGYHGDYHTCHHVPCESYVHCTQHTHTYTSLRILCFPMYPQLDIMLLLLKTITTTWFKNSLFPTNFLKPTLGPQDNGKAIILQSYFPWMILEGETLKNSRCSITKIHFQLMYKVGNLVIHTITWKICSLLYKVLKYGASIMWRTRLQYMYRVWWISIPIIYSPNKPNWCSTWD